MARTLVDPYRDHLRGAGERGQMPSPQGPLLPRRRLGAELKRLRGGRTLEEVATETLISTSKLSRLENGLSVPQPRDIRDLINFYSADRSTSDRLRRWMNDGRRQAWWREYSKVISDSVDVFLDCEFGAAVIRIVMPMVLPAWLQTPALRHTRDHDALPHRTELPRRSTSSSKCAYAASRCCSAARTTRPTCSPW